MLLLCVLSYMFYCVLIAVIYTLVLPVTTNCNNNTCTVIDGALIPLLPASLLEDVPGGADGRHFLREEHCVLDAAGARVPCHRRRRGGQERLVNLQIKLGLAKRLSG